MSVTLSPLAGAAAQFFDDNGDPLTGGKLYTYAAGTTTAKATYTDYTGAQAHSNPIILDAAGRTPSEIWLTFGDAYKFILKDSNDTLIGTFDNIDGIPPFYTARAWVVFNGSSASISASLNVTSVVKNATGNYTITFTTGILANANYAVSGSALGTTSLAPFVFTDTTTAPTAVTLRVQVLSLTWPSASPATAAYDSTRISVAVFG